MKASYMILAVLFLFISTGCTSGKKQAAELLETARFEEKQRNLAHATQLYDEIVSKYPSSSAAQLAAARQAELKRQTQTH